MATQIKFVVVGHHTRSYSAVRLASSIGAHLLIDDECRGANWNHRRAVEWAAQQDCRVVILEDDAKLVDGFLSLVAKWVERFPDDLVSFYLGTGRPPQYQAVIAQRLIEADRHCWDCITLPRLIHGVCYSPPQAALSGILARWDTAKPADFAVGDAYGAGIIYPYYSLVDHADGSAVEVHPDGEGRAERRRAWRLACVASNANG
ncbi:hypothetical protein [Pantoea phytobeneficialis]|uniref:Glycosyltransferase n=1 Tax=Pantoea phytobeneficialis TaxID=2052056 RepID=A0AAP9H3U5_9GAMM|nr:hypothetical protein [Pantoea phytobeneficialis]MDO6406267.1 hypothetical protein [Pantoea phytobeneficialis]QGR06240.1 hypothetical protein CTZ24_07395 [Pantoea phytobeneficialis]